MEILYKMGAIFGLLAFFQVSAVAARLRRLERSENSAVHSERSSVKDDMRKILAPYTGKEIHLDFYEDEEDADLELINIGGHNKIILLDMDEKWALVRIETPKNHRDKLIRISSIRGVSCGE